MVFGASITQPLLKGGGVKATMAGIEVAQADAEIAFQNYRGQRIRVISEAIASYWDLYLAREKYMIRKESEHNAMEILRDNLVRVKTGKMAETEVLEAEAGLALRRSLVSDAKQNIVYAMNRVRTFFSSSAAVAKAEIEPADRLNSEEVKLDFTDSLSKAFKLRADYLSTRKKIEREDIRLVFAENQRWPQLDLKGSYNMNGLTDAPRSSWNDAWDQNYETWSVGIELRIPLGGDRKSRSELEATRQRKKQALLELKALEVSLANDMDTATKGVQNVREQVMQYAGSVEMNRRLLEAENVRFKAGKSNSRLLLEREEELNKAKEAEIESLVRYRKSLLQLEMAEGSVLFNQGIENIAENSK
jgi:outer membrane protein TolC